MNSPIIKTYQCTTCHTIAGEGGTVGPVLNQVSNRRDEAWLRRWLKDPGAIKPGTKMPTFAFTPEEYEQVVGYLVKMKRDLKTEEILAESVPKQKKGEKLFRDFDCYACHRIGSEGRFVGPNLTWVGLRKGPEWEAVWLHDPPAWKPGTFMPNFHLSDEGVRALTAFLHSLQGQRNGEAQMWEFRTNFFLGSKAKSRGELIYQRFACWSCHQQDGAGGEKNPNAAPGGVTPGIRDATNKYSLKTLKERLSQQQAPGRLDPDKPAPPFSCPPYATHMTDEEFSDLYAFLKTFAPQKPKFRFR